MDLNSGDLLDEKSVLKKKKRYVAKHLWRGLKGEVFSEVELPLYERSLQWAKKMQVGLFLYLLAHLVSFSRRQEPRS